MQRVRSHGHNDFVVIWTFYENNSRLMDCRIFQNATTGQLSKEKNRKKKEQKHATVFLKQTKTQKTQKTYKTRTKKRKKRQQKNVQNATKKTHKTLPKTRKNADKITQRKYLVSGKIYESSRKSAELEEYGLYE